MAKVRKGAADNALTLWFMSAMFVITWIVEILAVIYG